MKSGEQQELFPTMQGVQEFCPAISGFELHGEMLAAKRQLDDRLAYVQLPPSIYPSSISEDPEVEILL